MAPQNKIILVSAPSGAGKSSFINRALSEYENLEYLVSYTTRSKREGESEGHPYHFVSQEYFMKLADEGFFLEWAKVHSNLYGTPKGVLATDEEVESSSQNSQISSEKLNEIYITDIDVQGFTSLKKLNLENLFSIFILPPSLDVIKQRIIGRHGGEPKDLDIRLKSAEVEIGMADQYDHQVVNDNFDESYAVFKKILAEITAAG